VLDLAIRRAEAADPDVLADARVEQEPVLGDEADRPPPWSPATRRRSSPPISMRPPVGSASRQSSDANVVLPDPVSPTIATLVPAGIETLTSRMTGGPVR